MCCSFIGCSLDPVNGFPASQERQYAIAAVEAIAATPFLLSEVGDAEGIDVPHPRGATMSYHPLGTTAAPGWRRIVLADGAGVMTRAGEELLVDEDNHSEHRMTPDGHEWTVTVAADTTTMTLSLVDGVGELCGTNLRICPAIMPLVLQWDVGGTIAFGNAQFNAALITTRVSSAVSTLATRGLRLEPMTVTTGDIRVIFCPTAGPPRTGCLLYPAFGESFTGLAVNAPYTLAMGVGLLLIGFAATPPQWCVIPFTV